MIPPLRAARALLLCLTVFAAGSVQAAIELPVHAVAEYIGLELESAPAPVLTELRRDDGRLREFIAGRLHDERVADYARKRGLADKPEVRMAVHRFERDLLARSVFTEFQQAERNRLPALEPLAREYYRTHLPEFEVPGGIRVAHILVAVDVEKLSEDEIAERRRFAQDLLARVRGGADFAELAREHSDDKGSAKDGGVLPGVQQRGRLVPPFEVAAWALAAGEISDLVRTRFGYHIIRVLEIVPATTRPFDEVKEGLILKRQNELLDPKRAAFIDSFRDAALEAEADALLPKMRERLHNLTVPAAAAETSSATPR